MVPPHVIVTRISGREITTSGRMVRARWNSDSFSKHSVPPHYRGSRLIDLQPAYEEGDASRKTAFQLFVTQIALFPVVRRHATSACDNVT